MKNKIQNGIGIACIVFVLVVIVCYIVSLHEDTHRVYEKIESSTTMIEEQTTDFVESTTTENSTEEITTEIIEKETTPINNSIYASINLAVKPPV